MTLRVGVLVSGSGTNLQAILDAADPAAYEVVLVVSNKSDSPALERAERAGVKAIAILPTEYRDRDTFDAAVAGELDGAGVELVCLAGYMRLLSASFVKRSSLSRKALSMSSRCFFIGPAVMGLVGLIEGILYLSKSDDDFYETYVVGRRSWF